MAQRSRRITLPFRSVDDKPYIFASYGHNDKEEVFPKLKQLYEAGYNVWYDEGIEINKAYDSVIAEHVHDSEVVVLFVTSHSITRPYVVENELGYANRIGKKILPLFIEKGVVLTPGVDMLLKGVCYKSMDEIFARLEELGVENFGARKAKEEVRDVPVGFLDEDDNSPDKDAGRNLVTCDETPYAYIGIHPEERSACRPYIKELYNAGYNVRSFEYDSKDERTLALINANCALFVPVLTQKYAAELLDGDAAIVRSANKPVAALLMDNEVKLSHDSEMLMGGKQMININELSSADFLAKIEDELKKYGCFIPDGKGGVERRVFDIPGFLYEFTEDGKGIVLTKYNGDDTDVVIKDRYYGYPVQEIGDAAFFGSGSLTSVTIPDSVTSIGDSAFSVCSSLTSVTIPDSVTSIGDSAFSGCSSLTSVTIPDSVTSIGSFAFWGCSSLTSVTIPDSVTSIGGSAFSGCRSLTSVTIPDSVTSIGYRAFSGCSSLTSVTIPNSVTSIGKRTFSGCSSLTSVTIPDSVTYIDDWTFEDCSSLTSVTIPESVTSIGKKAFVNCRSLTSITIPDSVTYIGDWAFSGCSGLASVTIPKSVTVIGDYAFYECSRLTSVTIPGSVKFIDEDAFKKCKLLTVFCPRFSKAWKYCKEKSITHKPLKRSKK